MGGSDLRHAVNEALARGDLAAAAKLAGGMSDPWYRCQALAAVAGGETNLAARTQLLDRAFAAALETPSPNRIVTVSSWPLSVLDRVGDERRVAREVSRLLGVLKGEPHPIRRMDALLALHNAVRSEPTRSELDRAVMAAVLAGHGWKRDAILAGRVIAAGNAGDDARALSLLAAIELPRARRVAARDLIERGTDIPGMTLDNLEERRRAMRELTKIRAEAAVMYAELAKTSGKNYDHALATRLREMGVRERAAALELQRTRAVRKGE